MLVRGRLPVFLLWAPVALTLTGCGDDGGPGPDQDQDPPSTIVDLERLSFDDTSVTLAWTAPGDDAGTGTASSYDLRYAERPIDAANWDLATQVGGEPTPQRAGTREVFAVDGLQPGGEYFFAVRAQDEVPNRSGVSNVVESPTAYRWSGNNHLYLIIKVSEGISWTDARDAAAELGPGWHLVTITTAEENAFAFDLADDDPELWTPVGSNYEGPWLGAFLVGPGLGAYEWVTDEPFVYTNWGPWEPFGNGDRLGFFGYQTPMGAHWNDVPEARLIKGYIGECSACAGTG